MLPFVVSNDLYWFFFPLQVLEEVLKVTKGSVSPFSLLNDTEKKVSVHVDKELLSKDKILFHPGTNERTVAVTSEELLAFLKGTALPPSPHGPLEGGGGAT